MKTFTWCALLATGSLFWGSCRKDPLSNLSSSESRIYITQFDSTVNFTTYKTFSVSDSATLLLNGQYAGLVRDSADSLFIADFEQGMSSRGYTLVDSSQSPDLSVNVTHISNTFPVYYGSYLVHTSGMAYDMFDLKNAATGGKQPKDIWSALIQGEQVFNPANVGAEVDTVFAQSAYLKQ